jgi:tetratricopeptide (TPR) repeat protein
MSNNLQDLSSITNVKPDDGQPAPLSEAQQDYESGRGYLERGETALAAVSLHNALHGFEQENNKEGMANAANRLGQVCLQREEWEKAIAHFKRAWAICEELNDPVSLISLTKQLVAAHRGQKQYRVALDLCLDLLDNYQRNNNPRGSVEVLETMSAIYLESGQRERAADALRTAASIHANFKHQASAEALRGKADALVAGTAS